MTFILADLVHQARTALGSAACKNGNHLWVSDGGRSCPHDIDDNCSQAVYTCHACGEMDYGDPGGPGESDCDQFCQNRVERAIATHGKRVDPLSQAWHWQHGGARKKARQKLQLAALRRQPKPRLP